MSEIRGAGWKAGCRGVTFFCAMGELNDLVGGGAQSIGGGSSV